MEDKPEVSYPTVVVATEGTPLIEDSSQKDPSDALSPKNERKFWDRMKEGASKKVTKKSLRKRAQYYIPAIGWVKNYKWKSDLISDFIAGITIGVILVPVSLSYAVLVGVPPIVGLQGAFYPVIIYCFFGSSRQMSIGPEAIVSILTSTYIDQYQTDTLSRTTLAITFTFLVGLFTTILGFFRFGFLAQLFSRPILGGFVNAVALEIIFEQSDKFFGLEFPAVHSFHKFPLIFEHWVDANYPTLAMGIGMIVFLLVFRLCKTKIKKLTKIMTYIPDSLIVVVVGILMTKYMHLDEKGVLILGYNEAGFLVPSYPHFNLKDLPSFASAALVIAIIGIVESILCAQTYADKHKCSISANRELVGVGLANLIGSFFQIFPSFGSLGRTALNDGAGAKTQLSSLFAAIVVLFSILFLLPHFAYLPKVAMGAIVVNAALGLLEVHDAIFLFKIRAWVELLLFVLTFVVTLVEGVTTGIIMSICISVFLIIKKESMPHVAILKKNERSNDFEEVVTITDINLFDDKHSWVTLSEYSQDRGILVVRIEASLYFANIGQLKELFQKIERRSKTPLSGVIIDFSSIPHVDSSALQTLLDIVDDWKSRKIAICFVKLRANTQSIFSSSRITERIGEENIFHSIQDAMNHVDKKL